VNVLFRNKILSSNANFYIPKITPEGVTKNKHPRSMANDAVHGTYKRKYYNDRLTNCDNRTNNENLPSSAGKKFKFHFVYNFAQPQISLNNILRPTTQSNTFHLTQNISDTESPVIRTASLSARTLRHSL
jgi:hypothetical protein